MSRIYKLQRTHVKFLDNQCKILNYGVTAKSKYNPNGRNAYTLEMPDGTHEIVWIGYIDGLEPVPEV